MNIIQRFIIAAGVAAFAYFGYNPPTAAIFEPMGDGRYAQSTGPDWSRLSVYWSTILVTTAGACLVFSHRQPSTPQQPVNGPAAPVA